MPNVEVRYLLNEQGRKKFLLSGGDGKYEKFMLAPMTEDLVKLGEVDKNGNITWRVGYRGAYESKYGVNLKGSVKENGC